MKPSILLAAAAVASIGLAPGLSAPALAQHTVVHERTVVRSGPPPHGAHVRQSCHVERHGHRHVRVCRTVRYR